MWIMVSHSDLTIYGLLQRWPVIFVVFKTLRNTFLLAVDDQCNKRFIGQKLSQAGLQTKSFVSSCISGIKKQITHNYW